MNNLKNDTLKKIGIIIRDRRQVLGLTNAQLASISGVSPTLISQLETFKRKSIPKVDTLNALSKALKIGDNNLIKIAGYIIDKSELEIDDIDDWQEKLSLFLASIGLNADNISKSVSYIKELMLFQDIKSGDLGKKVPELKEILERWS